MSILNYKLLYGILFCLCIPLACTERTTEPDFRNLEWEEIVEVAEGQDLYWYMWGGSSVINAFVDGYLADMVQDRYQITIHMVPVSDTALAVNKVQGENKAGKDRGGSVDLIWINGENFSTMHSQGLLYGPFADMLPNMRYAAIDPSTSYDFGYPVDGYESPYGSARIAFIYDSTNVSNPFRSIEKLIPWVRANPGVFTYPAIPDFTGSAFVRHIFYYIAGGYEEFQGVFNREVYERYAPSVWTYLNELEPYLWRGGNTYPESRTQMQTLYEQGEIFYDITYHPNDAANFIEQGRYPASSRTYILDDGTIGNTHFLAIPYNASNKAAALVVANAILEPEVQLNKSLPEVWGDYTVLDIEQLTEEWKERFLAVPVPESVLSHQDISRNRLPEMHTSWLEHIEEDWIKQVLQ